MSKFQIYFKLTIIVQLNETDDSPCKRQLLFWNNDEKSKNNSSDENYIKPFQWVQLCAQNRKNSDTWFINIAHITKSFKISSFTKFQKKV